MLSMEVDDVEYSETEANRRRSTREVIFYRQNRKGRPLKISREKYLRTDIPCGSQGCTICPPNARLKCVLDGNPPIHSNVFSYKHYLLPDASFVVRQLDVLEELENVILLQGVMEDVFRLSTNKYKRVRDGAKSRKCLYFMNEHHSETYVDRRPDESTDERNRRAFLTCYQYFRKHGSNRGIQVIILSDDPDFATKHSEGLDEYTTVCTGEKYVTGMKEEFQELEDKLCRIPFNEDEAVKKYAADFSYPPHLEMREIQDGLKSQKFTQGAYRCCHFYEGTVRIDGDKAEAREILIQTLENVNRATDGDIVAVEIFDESKWSNPSGLVVIDEDEPTLTAETVLENQEDTVEITKPVQGLDKKPTGRVVGIIRRKWLPCCGVIRKSQNESSSFHLFLPDNRRLPRVRIETRNVSRFDGQKILVQIDQWPLTSRNPIGHYLKILGPVGTIETETEAILHEHGIPHDPFSKAVEACLPSLPYEIPADQYVLRTDFRNKIVCSVDPPGCTDIDDALHCEKLDDGTFLVGVHIADVSHYVEVDTALDLEAAKRGTTVYLADRRIDMIPPLLSSNLCSLHAGTEKLTFSVIWKLSADAHILETNFYKGIICSKAAMTYAEAQGRLNSKFTDPITLSLKNLSMLAQILKKRRFENGALMLTSAEVNEDGEAEGDCQESHSLVEEFMLLANCSVAQFTLETFRDYSLLRRHPTPPPTNFEPLLLAARTHGIVVVVDNGSKALNESIENQANELKNILRVLTTRCMTQALYCCSGTTAIDEYGHFGLAVKLYTHFTSPIRRYADLMVHRLLAIAIKVEPIDPRVMASRKVHNVCENINLRHRMAQYASRASHNIHKSRLLRGKTEEHAGYVMFIRRNALQIFVPKYSMEGFIFYPKNGVYFYNEKDGQVQFGEITIRPLDKVVVELSLEEKKDKVLFRLITPNVPGLN